MKKKKIFKLALLFITIIVFNPTIVLAHPGRTDASGCHTCRTNCAKWGLSNGQYHCHNGGGSTSSSSSSSSSASSSSNTPSPPKKEPKSSDNTLKSVIIDDESIIVRENMNYKTKKEKVEIKIETNDKLAKYEVDNHNLEIGDNTITIKVTAEDGSTKNYNLVINREPLSNNTNIRVLINNKEVKFKDKVGNINISSSDKVTYKYFLKDENATVEIDEINDLKVGENKMVFHVTAEDGTKDDYEVIINKSSKEDENSSAVLGFIATLVIGFIIYKLYKKRKS